MKHVNIRIYGRVQRIGFRFQSMQVAYKFNVTGLVRNMDDGSVHIEAEGEVSNIEKFIEWCKIGPLGARIEKIYIEEGDIKSYTSFDIDHV
jgi:acylphosphatase